MDPSRRDLICATGLTIALAAVRPTASYAQSQNGPVRDEISVWMNTWMSAAKGNSGTLRIGRFADPMYFLLKPITWKPNPDQQAYDPVTVPTGFVTDFASVPRVFWSLLPPDGLYTYPAIVHDYMYWTQTRPKKDADSILKFGMQDFGVSAATTSIIYEAVSRFGDTAWEQNKRLKEAGERRVLRTTPDDPLITWDAWKKNPGVFEAI